MLSQTQTSVRYMGGTRTVLKLRQKCYWVGFKKNIITWCKTCKICDSYKLGHVPKRAPLQHKPIVMSEKELLVILWIH